MALLSAKPKRNAKNYFVLMIFDDILGCVRGLAKPSPAREGRIWKTEYFTVFHCCGPSILKTWEVRDLLFCFFDLGDLVCVWGLAKPHTRERKA